MQSAVPQVEAPTDWGSVMDPVEEGDARYSLDSRLLVQFYVRPVLQGRESDLQGRPIFKDCEFVRILIPGDKLNTIDRLASQDDKSRFATQYAKFKAGQGQEVVGTPLEAVPWMTRSKVEEYRYFGIRSVEQLADASDEVGQKFQGFQADKRRAKNFLEASTGTSARVSELEKMVEELKAKLEVGDKPAKTAATPKA